MVRKSIYTRRLGNDVAKKAKGSIGKYHIIPAQIDKWSVVAEGNVKPVKAFSTQRDAVVFAKGIVASALTGEVSIHGMDGKTLSRISYNNPHLHAI